MSGHTRGSATQTPAERYLPAPAPSAPLGELALAEGDKSPTYAPHSVTRKVWGHGVVSFDGFGITLGRRYRRLT
jgi:hypothetical protein